MRVLRYLAAGALAVFAATPALASENDIMINGSTTVLPAMQKVSEAFMSAHPGVNLSISGGGSGNGIKALNDGLCDIAMASRDMKAKEHQQGEAKGIKAVRHTIALDAIAPVVHPDNKVSGLTVEQLRSIYAGELKNWKEVGGDDAPIVVISRDSSSGTFETWAELVMNKKRVAPNALLQASNGAVAQAVSKNKNAIGYVGFSYLNNTLKDLTVNGKHISADTAADHSWPISRALFLFTNGEPRGNIKTLIDFILDPRKGQKLVEQAGYIPLNK